MHDTAMGVMVEDSSRVLVVHVGLSEVYPSLSNFRLQQQISMQLIMPDLDLISYLEPITSACPLQAGSLTTTVRDLQLAVGWVEQRPLVLPGTKWCAIIGRKRKEVSSWSRRRWGQES